MKKKYTTYKLSYLLRSIISVTIWLTMMSLFGVLVYLVMESQDSSDKDTVQGVAEGMGIGIILFGIMFAIASMWCADTSDTLYQMYLDSKLKKSIRKFFYKKVKELVPNTNIDPTDVGLFPQPQPTKVFVTKEIGRAHV